MDLTSRERPVTVPPQRPPCHPLRYNRVIDSTTCGLFVHLYRDQALPVLRPDLIRLDDGTLLRAAGLPDGSVRVRAKLPGMNNNLNESKNSVAIICPRKRQQSLKNPVISIVCGRRGTILPYKRPLLPTRCRR
jgi:hypothetical protein